MNKDRHWKYNIDSTTSSVWNRIFSFFTRKWFCVLSFNCSFWLCNANGSSPEQWLWNSRRNIYWSFQVMTSSYFVCAMLIMYCGWVGASYECIVLSRSNYDSMSYFIVIVFSSTDLVKIQSVLPVMWCCYWLAHILSHWFYVIFVCHNTHPSHVCFLFW